MPTRREVASKRLQNLAATLSKKQLANMGYGTKSKITAKPSRASASAADAAQIQNRLATERATGMQRGVYRDSKSKGKKKR